MFNKILIANRGEIACRIIGTATNMGIAAVAVYSEADRSALHVQQADEAYPIGPASLSQSYLNQENIIQAALDSKAEAIHPGYGFLSENPEFAQQCHEAGLVFIGPNPRVIREMGIKSRAKSLMTEAGIPCIPGYHGTLQDIDTLYKEAAVIGFPLLIKADRGGGGKGIRLVNSPKTFKAALAAAQREATGAFDHAQVILEKYLTNARHIEVQIFRDSHGNGVHLFERDCSLQRRHQKIVEESPAPGLDEKLRNFLHTAAVNAAHTIDYVGAGTVEFLVDESGIFYFMEINTRLQVEHPVTEMITGQDLVEWQIRIAAGEPLPCSQQKIQASGHAIEARIYAEDPTNGFMPSSGTIHYLKLPETGPGIRLENGIQSGDVVTPYYDPLLAKLIVWAKTRAEAVQQLHVSLQHFHLAGIATNIAFLSTITEHQPFISAQYATNTIDSAINVLTLKKPPSDTVLAAAGFLILLKDEQRSTLQAKETSEPNSPWNCTSGYQVNDNYRRSIRLIVDDKTVHIEVELDGSDYQGYRLHLPSKTVLIHGTLASSGQLTATINGRNKTYQTAHTDHSFTLFSGSSSFTFTTVAHRQQIGSNFTADTDFRSPMPAIVSKIFITPGTEVKKGENLLSLEAMKMEHTIKAPQDGKVEEILCSEGGQVDGGDKLIMLTPKK